jgi:hypothetical protein
MYINDQRLASFTLVNPHYIIKNQQNVITGAGHYRNESLPYLFVAVIAFLVTVMTFVVTVMTASLRNAQIKTRINQFCSTLN